MSASQAPQGVPAARRKPSDPGLLRKIYESHYAYFNTQAPQLANKAHLEIGSGSGFFREQQQHVITSEIWASSEVDLQCSATKLPFEDNTLATIYLLDVLHHIQQVEQFFAEAQRCLTPGGAILMVEPANTPFGRFIYKNFHHEDFEPDADSWQLPAGDPRLAANGALPWILFDRDRAVFQERYPNLEVALLEPCLPFRYLLSGGLSRPQLLPTSSYALVEWVEEKLPRWLLNQTGMFYRIRINKT